MVILYTEEKESKEILIKIIFLSLELHGNSSEYMISRATLSTKNEHIDELNNMMIDRFSGEEKIYHSFDMVEDDTSNNYTVNFLNSLTPGGLPPHLLRLKINCPIILLRNIDPPNGMCNDTRLICRAFQPNVINAEITVDEHARKRVFLLRIPLCPSEDDMFPFRLKRN
jgi:ATP-dependent DNA helicase PIF1